MLGPAPELQNGVALSVVIPACGEEALNERLHTKLIQALDQLTESPEVVFTGDVSSGRSLDPRLKVQITAPPIVIAELSRNWGHQQAVTAGLTVVRGKAVVQWDGDLQDLPWVIADLVNLMP